MPRQYMPRQYMPRNHTFNANNIFLYLYLKTNHNNNIQ